MSHIRLRDPVQCKICGFAGPAKSANTCPWCRDTGTAASLYVTSANEALRMAHLLMQTAHKPEAEDWITVVRATDDQTLFHFSMLQTWQVQAMFQHTSIRFCGGGVTLFLSYQEGNRHRVVAENLSDLPSALRATVTLKELDKEIQGLDAERLMLVRLLLQQQAFARGAIERMDLQLSPTATDAELQAAREAFERGQTRRHFGLPDDASDEDVRIAAEIEHRRIANMDKG